MTLLSTFKSATSALWLPNLRGVTGYLLNSHRIWRERQQLLRLDASQLDDIGLSRDEAVAEAARPIWDAPATWRT
jgi:uncharacterized protein YjiS (DUF1127 family)